MSHRTLYSNNESNQVLRPAAVRARLQETFSKPQIFPDNHLVHKDRRKYCQKYCQNCNSGKSNKSTFRKSTKNNTVQREGADARNNVTKLQFLTMKNKVCRFIRAFFIRLIQEADLARGRERQMTTGWRAEQSGYCSILAIFWYHCARRRQMRFPLSC